MMKKTRNRRGLASALAGLLLMSLLFGCAPTAEGPSASPSPSASAPASPTASTAVSPSPTPSQEISEVKMAPGTYDVEGWGYSFIEPMQVSVTVSETAITDIQIVNDWQKTRENGPILQTVIDNLVPRILQSQSIAVDSVCGATYSSAGLKSALRTALTQALEAGGSTGDAIETFMVPPERESGSETLETDILVVGMGGSGCAAATSAAQTLYEAGKDVNVLAIDKSAKYGGTSSNAGEMLAVNPEKFQAEFHDGEDYTDIEALMEQWLDCTQGGEKEDLVRTYLEHSGETLDWLVYEHGFDFNVPAKGLTAAATCLTRYGYAQRLTAQEGREYKLDLASEGTRTMTVTKYFDTMMEHYYSYGGKSLFEVEAYELLSDAEGRVTGVKARSTASDKEYTIHAKQVIMACGGFGGNSEMIEKYMTDEPYPTKMEWKDVYGMQQNDGTLMQYAIDALDAGTCNIGVSPMVHLKATGGVIRDYPVTEYDTITGGYVFLGRPAVWGVGGSIQNLTLGKDSLWVGLNGKRFCSEASFWDYWKQGPVFYSIWGEEQISNIAQNGFTSSVSTNAFSRGDMKPGIPVPEIYDVIDKAVSMGIAYKADTLDELAGQMGVSAENLKEAVENYNAACAEGEDKEFGKAADQLVSLGETGPYYCFVGHCALYSTCGGLDVNTQMQVLKTDGETVIPGLYAVGTDSLGVLYSEKTDYNIPFGGEALGWAFTSGKLAGEAAAAALG